MHYVSDEERWMKLFAYKFLNYKDDIVYKNFRMSFSSFEKYIKELKNWFPIVQANYYSCRYKWVNAIILKQAKLPRRSLTYSTTSTKCKSWMLKYTLSADNDAHTGTIICYDARRASLRLREKSARVCMQLYLFAILTRCKNICVIFE